MSEEELKTWAFRVAEDLAKLFNKRLQQLPDEQRAAAGTETLRFLLLHHFKITVSVDPKVTT